ncbi:hypothetical protein JCM6882_006833 [Rhodosporidiobolus microsporus]
MSLAIVGYLESPSMRSPVYYGTWALYYLSYALSPGLVTVLQVLTLVLTWGLPWLEAATHRFRLRVATSAWATTAFRDEFVDPTVPPAEWPGWLQATGSALDVRWMGSSVWAGISGAVKWMGSWVGLGGGAVAHPPPPTPIRAFTAPAFAAHSPRPVSVRSPSMPVFPPSEAGHGGHFASGASFRSVPLEAVGGSVRSRASNPFTPQQQAPLEHDDDRGSVWNGSGWKQA